MRTSELITIFVIIIAAVLFMVLYTIPRMTAEVYFISEKVVLTVRETETGHNLEVEGYYFFENPNTFHLTRRTYFPYLSEYGLLLPESVLVTDAKGQDGGDWKIFRGFNVFPHRIDYENARFSFQFRFPKQQTTIMACRYVQKLDGNDFGYRITLDEPLKAARFEIHLPKGYLLAKSNHEYTCVEDLKDERYVEQCIWRFDAENFMPEKGIEISFVKSE